MTAAEPATRSSHLSQPGEGAPTLREGASQRVFPEIPALRQAPRQEGEKGASAVRSRISTARLSSAYPEIDTVQPLQPVVG